MTDEVIDIQVVDSPAWKSDGPECRNYTTPVAIHRATLESGILAAKHSHKHAAALVLISRLANKRESIVFSSHIEYL